MIVDALEHGDGTGAGQHLRGGQLRRPARHTQHAAVEVETNHLGHDLRRSPIERCRRAAEITREFREPPVGAQEGVRDEPGCQHALHHQHALGDHQTLAGRQIGPAVDAVEVAEVINPTVAGVRDIDDAGAVHVARLR